MNINHLTNQFPEISNPCTQILIIESNPQVSSVVELLLKHENYTTYIINDGQEAIEYIKAAKPPSAVILDVDLPYIDGYNVIKQLRSNNRWKNVPVVFLSSKATEKDIVRCFELGASDYILKPFSPSEFIARVNRLVKQAA